MDEISVLFLGFIVLQTAKTLMVYHDPSQIEDLKGKKKTHSSPSFCNPLLLLTEAMRFMRRLVACASEGEVVRFVSDCWARPAVVWGIGALPSNGGFDSPLACPRRDCQALPLPVPRWTCLLFMLLVLDISMLWIYSLARGHEALKSLFVPFTMTTLSLGLLSHYWITLASATLLNKNQRNLDQHGNHIEQE